MADYQLNVKINGADVAIKTVAQLEDALEKTRDELRDIEIGSDSFNELTKQARNLQGELDRTFESATNFNSSIGLLAQSVSRLGGTVAAGFSLAISSFQLFGSEAEELTEAQIKAQESLNFALSATTFATNVATAATDAKFVLDKLSLGVTTALTAAIGKETVAKSAQAVATGTATVAQRALNAAMSANPIGLLITAIGALTAAYFLFSDSSDDSKESVEDFSDAMNKLNKDLKDSEGLIKTQIDFQKKLIVEQGRVAEAFADSEEEKIKIRIRTNRELFRLDLERIDLEISNLQRRLNTERQVFDDIISLAVNAYERKLELENQGITNTLNILTQEQEAIAQVTLSYQEQLLNKQLTDQQKAQLENDYYNEIFRLRSNFIENNKNLTAEEKRIELESLQRQRQIVNELKNANNEKILLQTQYNNQVKILNKELTDNNKSENDQRIEDDKKALEERLKIQEEFNNLVKDNVKEIQQLTEEQQDLLIEQISNNSITITDLNRQLNNIKLPDSEEFKKFYEEFRKSIDKSTDSVEELLATYLLTGEVIPLNIPGLEDNIKQYDENIIKLKTLQKRALDDLSKEQTESINTFKKQSEEAGILAEETQKRIEQLEDQFTERRLKIQENFNIKIVQQETEKQQEITKINKEAADLNFSNNINNEIKALEIINTETELYQNKRLNNIKEISNKRINIINLETDRELDALVLKLEKELKEVQGTEEQKVKIRKQLIEQYLIDVDNITKQSQSKREKVEKETDDNITNYKLENLQKVSDVTFQSLNGILNFASSLNELRNVQIDNAINDIQRFADEQVNILNTAYNDDLTNLQSKLADGLISQQDYNNSIENLRNKLDDKTKTIQESAAAREEELNKKAFERDKKLRIAQAIISGFEGAVQAFTSAFALGPIIGPILGGTLAALVAATTTANVSAIKATQYNGGSSVSGVNSGIGGASLASGQFNTNLFNPVSGGGGFTQFNEELINPPAGLVGPQGEIGYKDIGLTKVVVLESDITNAQNKVRLAESSATFG